MSKAYVTVAVAALSGWLIARADFTPSAHAQGMSANGFSISCASNMAVILCGVVNNATGQVTSCNLTREKCQVVGKAE